MAKETSKDAKAAEIAGNKAEETQEQALAQERAPKEQQVPKEQPKAVKVPVYPASEIAANAGKLFGTRQECVAAALKAAGKTECTVLEAKEIVEKFLKREVK